MTVVFVEFIGCTSSGKTTLLSQLRTRPEWQQMNLVMVDDAFLGTYSPRIRHKKMRALIIDLLIVFRCAPLIFRRRKLICMAARQSWKRKDGVWRRLNYIRIFVKRLALFDYFSCREGQKKTSFLMRDRFRLFSIFLFTLSNFPILKN